MKTYILGAARIIILIQFLSIQLSGQTYFRKSFLEYEDNEFRAIAKLSDSSVIVTGVLDKDILPLIKFDGNGNVLWAKKFHVVQPSSPNAGIHGNGVIITSDQHIVVSGMYLDIADSAGLLIMKFDLNGNLLWNKVIPAW